MTTGTEIVDAGWSVLTQRLPSFSEFASTIIVPDGSYSGAPYDPSMHPAQACIAQAVDAGASWIAIAKPVQDGGSLIAFALMLWRVVSRGQTAILAYPTLGAARDAWTKKLAPMLGAIDKLPVRGGGSGGGAASVIQVPGGGSVIIRSAGGRHESQQASATGDILIPDEVDDWPDLRRVKLIEQRISKSPDPLQVFISTVKRDGAGKAGSHILRLWEQGTRTRLEYPCPHCGEFHALIWENVELDKGTMKCPECKHSYGEADRLAMLKSWRRVDGHRSDQFSIKWTALDSPFPIVVDGRRQPVITGLIREFRGAEEAAKDLDHDYMRQFYRDRLCRPYTADQQAADAPVIVPMMQAARSSKSPHSRGEIPEGCAVTTIGADAGKTTSWWLRIAMRQDLTWYIIDWSRKRVDETDTSDDGKREPTEPERIAMFDKVRDRAARIGKADAMGIDVGYTPDLVVKWARANGFRCVRGDYRKDGKKETPFGRKEEDRNRTLPSWAEDRTQDDGSHWLFLKGTVIKTEIAKALAREPNTPTAGHLPRGQLANDWLIKHLTAEKWIQEYGKWEASGRPNHLWDCLVYAWALAVIHLGKPQRTTNRKYGAIKSI